MYTTSIRANSPYLTTLLITSGTCSKSPFTIIPIVACSPPYSLKLSGATGVICLLIVTVLLPHSAHNAATAISFTLKYSYHFQFIYFIDKLRSRMKVNVVSGNRSSVRATRSGNRNVLKSRNHSTIQFHYFRCFRRLPHNHFIVRSLRVCGCVGVRLTSWSNGFICFCRYAFTYIAIYSYTLLYFRTIVIVYCCYCWLVYVAVVAAAAAAVVIVALCPCVV